jgi:UDP-N-acetylmuramate--alanine ligase
MIQFTPQTHIHIIGIGGSGMSAIARILLERGCSVSGSDRNTNPITDGLAQLGATIYQGHDGAYVHGADMLIISSAIKPDHPEVLSAQSQHIPIYKRRDVLMALMGDQKVLGVAGTHGKTTTTGLTTHILLENNLNPSYIIGSVMGNTGKNATYSTGEWFVIEADEYDDMFLGLRPHVTILTSMEYDHPDYFTSEAMMIEKFAQYLDQIQHNGTLIACMDYPLVRQQVEQLKARRRDIDIIGYSVRGESSASMRAENIQTDTANGTTQFEMHIATGGQITLNAGTVVLPMMGEHNVANALASIIASDVTAHVLFYDAVQALVSFKSTSRRFEVRGIANDVIVIDDYAHHPTAVKLVCEATKARYPDRQIWAVWQPHMYSRTQILIDDYRGAFGADDRVVVDQVIVTDIYAAREAPIAGVDGAWVAGQINHPNVHYTGDLSATADYLLQHVPPHSVIVIMSAGDAPQIGENFLRERS